MNLERNYPREIEKINSPIKLMPSNGEVFYNGTKKKKKIESLDLD